MRLLILASSSQKGDLANKLIQDPELSTVVVTPYSKKFIREAQAIVVYFESDKDINNIRDIIKIYEAVPILVYLGKKQYEKSQKPFYSFDKVNSLIEDVKSHFKEICQSSDFIYENLLAKYAAPDNGISVQSMISDMKAKDILLEPLTALFQAQTGGQSHEKIKSETVKVDQKDFKEWWSQGNVDEKEWIKYYIMRWMLKQRKIALSNEQSDQKSQKSGQENEQEEQKEDSPNDNQQVKEIKGYSQEQLEIISKLNEYFTSTIAIRVKEEGKKFEEPMQKLWESKIFEFDNLIKNDSNIQELYEQALRTECENYMKNQNLNNSALLKFRERFHAFANGKPFRLFKYETDIEQYLNPETTKHLEVFNTYRRQIKTIIAPKNIADNKFNITIKGIKASDEQRKQDARRQKKDGTKIDFNLSFFYDQERKDINDLQQLHKFPDQSNSWFSIGLKPKSKDLKTFYCDLCSLDYFDVMRQACYENCVSIIADGPCVRLGLQLANELDPFEKLAASDPDLTNIIEDIRMGKEEGAEINIEGKLTIGNRLLDIIDSDEPLIVQLLEKLHAQGRMKVNKRYFRRIWEKGCKEVYKEYVGGVEVAKPEPEIKIEEKGQDKEEKQGGLQKENRVDGFQDNYQDDNEYNDYDIEVQSESEEEDYDSEEDVKKTEPFDIIGLLYDILPLMLFKWNANIDCKPELEDLLELSKENKDQSVFFKSFGEAMKQWHKESETAQHIKKGSKLEIIQYLKQEVSLDVDIQWKTQFFYLSAQIKTDEVGKIIDKLAKAGLI